MIKTVADATTPRLRLSMIPSTNKLFGRIHGSPLFFFSCPILSDCCLLCELMRRSFGLARWTKRKRWI
jgi:hypothetical protein